MCALSALFLLGTAAWARAGSHTWSGGGSTDQWSIAANWSSGGPPVAGEAGLVVLTFPSTASSKTTIDNVVGLEVDRITIDGGHYILQGQGGAKLTFTGSRGYGFVTTNSSAPNTVQSTLPIVFNATVNIYPDYDLALQSVISGAGGLNVDGPVFLEGTADNTYTGTTTVYANLNLQKSSGHKCFAGPVVVDGGVLYNGADEQIPDTVAVTLQNGGLYYVSAYGETLGSLTLNGGTVHAEDGGGLLTIAGNVSVAGTSTISGHFALGAATRTFDVANGVNLYVDAVVSDLIGGPGGITKSGLGTLYLEQPNAFTGPLSVNGGTCVAYADTSVGMGTATVSVSAGASLWFTNPPATALSISSGKPMILAGTIFYQVNVTWAGLIVLSGSTSSIEGAATVSGPLIFTHTGVITGTGTLTKNGAGRLDLLGTAANSYAGGTTLNQGVVYLGKSSGNAIPGDLAIGASQVYLSGSNQIADSAAVTMAGGLLALGSRTETIASLAGTAGEVNFAQGVLTLGGTNASMTFNGLLSGYGSNPLVKNGSGNLQLLNSYTGADTLIGGIVVNAGTLTVNGVESSGVTVNANGVLTGTGTVGAVNVVGGRVSLGSLKTGNLTVSGGAAQVMAVIPSLDTYDHVKVTGTVNLTGATLAATLSYVPYTGASYTLIENDGTEAITGTFSGLPEGQQFLISGKTFSITYHGGSGNDVTLNLVGAGLTPPVITSFSVTTVPAFPSPLAHVHITAVGQPNLQHQLQYSAELQTWHNYLSPATSNAQGQMSFDTTDLQEPRLFYRVTVQ